MLTLILVIVSVVLQTSVLFIVMKGNPDAAQEIEKKFKGEKLMSNQATDSSNSNSLQKTNPSLDETAKLSLGDSGSKSASVSASLNPETHPEPDSHPNAETHLSEESGVSSGKSSQLLPPSNNIIY